MGIDRHPPVPTALRGSLCALLIVAALLPLSSLWAGENGTAAPVEETQKGLAPYQIGPEDLLKVSVWKEPELQREVLVRPDGGISFPLAGHIQAAGKTLEAVQKELTERIRRYIPEAVVTVSLAELAGYRIYVIGKVNSPGQFIVGRYVDVLQALALAGGLSTYASEDDIKIMRRRGGQQKVMAFNYAEIKNGDGLERNVVLQSGDVVVVP